MTRSIARVAMGALLVLFAALPGQAGGRDGGGAAFQFRLGGFFPRGDGAFWADNEARFTLDHTDFKDPVLGFSFVNSMSNHLEIGFNLDFYDATVASAERGFVDADGFPIVHDTELTSVPMTLDVRLLPGGRYRIRGPHGRHVRQPVFYIGGGIGLNYWEYEERGDFVDDSDPADPFVYFDRFTDTGVAFEAHALAGVELPFGHSWNLLLEGRYSWADDELGNDFAGFGELDLGGAAVYAGASFRF